MRELQRIQSAKGKFRHPTWTIQSLALKNGPVWPKRKKIRSLKLNYPAEVPEKLELLQSSPLLKCAPALINSVLCPFMNSIFGCKHFFQLQKFKQINLLG